MLALARGMDARRCVAASEATATDVQSGSWDSSRSAMLGAQPLLIALPDARLDDSTVAWR